MILQPTNISQKPNLCISLLPSSIPIPSRRISFVPFSIQTLLSIKCSVSRVHSYNTVDYEKRPTPTWHTVYKKISLSEDRFHAEIVLDECERDGRFKLNKWKLFRVVKELRKFKRYAHALQVYQWMNDRSERFIMTTSDIAIQVDLIAKVHGAVKAKDYFSNLSDTVKDNRTYGALLNAYVQAKMRDEAESLMEKMQGKGYTTNSLPHNLMMTLYLNLKEYDKVDSIVSVMKDKNIRLDIYSYNIWISSCGYQGSIEKVEQAFELMKADDTIVPNWSTFSTLATMYIKLGDMEKAANCLKMVETRITGRDRSPYHYLLSLYSSVGLKDEVYRMWNVYKSSFPSVVNQGYQTVVSSLVRLDDIEGAKEIYKEWVSVQSSFDPRITNILMNWYVKQGLVEKARVLFDDMVALGGKGNALTWEILAEGEIRQKRIMEALSFLKEAPLADRSKRWKPKPINVNSVLELCKEVDDVASKDVMIGILRETGCFEDEAYMSYIPLANEVESNLKSFVEESKNDDKDVDTDADVDGAEMILKQLQESL